MLATREEILALRPSLEPVLDKLARNGGSHLTADLLQAFNRIRSSIQAIRDHGVLVKDVNVGLLDFPATRESRVVFLCWRYGEPQIAYWHDLDAGFAGRTPL